MDFYCARLATPTTNGIYVLSLNQKKFLVGGSVNLDYLTHYLPNFGDFIDDSFREASNQKSDKNSKSINNNPYYIKINEKNYIRYPIKFDLSDYDLLDLKDIDYILISNLDSLSALPYLTECTNFSGQVLATTPIIQVGSYFLQEFSKMTLVANKTPKDQIGSFFEESNLFDVFEDEGLKMQEWVDVYSAGDIQNSFAKMTALNFGENYQIDGDLVITPVSSGFSFGSCNWTMQFKSHKISIISNSSSDTTNYTKPLDVESLKHSGVVVLTQSLNTRFVKSYPQTSELVKRKLSNGDILKAELLETIQSHLNSSSPGNILMPLSDPQILLTLLEFLSVIRTNISRIHVISSSFEAIVAYANVSVEYLSNSMGQRVYLDAKEVFAIDELKKAGKLIIYEDIATFQKMNLHNESGLFDHGAPSFYFVGHSSFRIGYSAKFLDFFINSQKRSPLLILTDPKFSDALLLSPFSTKKLEIKRCYLESSVTLKEASSIIDIIKESNREVRTTTLVAPKAYLTNKSDIDSISLVIDKNIRLIEYGEDDELHVDLTGSNFKRCYLKFEKSLNKIPAGNLFPGMLVYSIEGTIKLNEENNLEALVKEADETVDEKCSQIYLSHLTIERKIQNLNDEFQKLKLYKIFVGKIPDENKSNEKIKAIYQINQRGSQVMILHNSNSTKVFFSDKAENEALIISSVKKAFEIVKDNF